MPQSGSLYIHVPFCKKKCPYCHFFVIPDQERFIAQYLDALELEWARESHKFKDKQITSIYFGGGTPTLIGAERLAAILSWFPFDSRCEITVETNPDDVSLPLVKTLAQAGVNRMSLGVQSLDDSLLSILGREHHAKKAIQAIQTIAQGGIENISIDLMYDIPSQTTASWQRTLDQIGTLPITHLSLYNLTFEPHTIFFKRQKELKPNLPTPQESLEMLQMAVSSLEHLGFKRYEISAFAKNGLSSIHNTGYWTGRPFIGLGPSAFSYWEGKRYRNIAHLGKYAEALKKGQSPVDFSEELPYPHNLQELIAIHLRLLEGVDLTLYGNLSPDILAKLDLLVERGWLKRQQNRYLLSPEGVLFYDSVASEII